MICQYKFHDIHASSLTTYNFDIDPFISSLTSHGGKVPKRQNLTPRKTDESKRVSQRDMRCKLSLENGRSVLSCISSRERSSKEVSCHCRKQRTGHASPKRSGFLRDLPIFQVDECELRASSLPFTQQYALLTWRRCIIAHHSSKIIVSRSIDTCILLYIALP